jgi:hypothetical protein
MAYQPLSHNPRTAINWRFCLAEGLVRSLLLVVVCVAAYSSYRTRPRLCVTTRTRSCAVWS